MNESTPAPELVESAATAMWYLYEATLPRADRFSTIPWDELEEVNREAWRTWVRDAAVNPTSVWREPEHG